MNIHMMINAIEQQQSKLMGPTMHRNTKIITESKAFAINVRNSTVALHHLDLAVLVQEGRVACDASDVLEVHSLRSYT